MVGIRRLLLLNLIVWTAVWTASVSRADVDGGALSPGTPGCSLSTR
jgi:hypothetical protein